MKLTREFLQNTSILKVDIPTFEEKFGKEAELNYVFKYLVENKYRNLAFGLLIEILSHKNLVKLSLFALKENNIIRSNDDKNKCIRAITEWLENPTDKNKERCKLLTTAIGRKYKKLDSHIECAILIYALCAVWSKRNKKLAVMWLSLQEPPHLKSLKAFVNMPFLIDKIISYGKKLFDKQEQEGGE